MVGRSTPSLDGSTVLVFGPQALSFNDEAFQRLRATILRSNEYGWILDLIAGLPNCLNSIEGWLPKVMTGPRSSLLLLEELQSWLTTGKTWKDFSNIPNALLSPLVVMTQLVQFFEWQKTLCASCGNGQDLYDLSRHDVETLGFCTGFLSALVVSHSTSQESFEKLGAIAIRLSMLIGIIVDAQNEAEEGGVSKSLATIWHSQEEKQKMLEIMRSFPEVRPVLDLQPWLTCLQA